MNQDTPRPALPRRALDNHKGDFGRALLVGGSSGMAGSIGLAGMAALRSGAGLVTIATPESVASTVAAYEPSYMTLALEEKDGRLSANSLDTLLERTEQATSLAVGPGLGRSRSLVRLVSRLYHHAELPSVFDADALNALAESPTGSKTLRRRVAPRIITPHLGEFRRLAKDEQLDRDAAIRLAEEMAKIANADHPESNQLVIVLKGAGTIITDGRRKVVNKTGNPGMATGGTGDVLTGLITGFLAQGMPAFKAAVAAVHVHGAAGDLAAEQTGEISLIASDLIKHLPAAIKTYKNNPNQ